MRRYKSGTKWCVWRWMDVILNEALYLRRLHVFQCPWFAIMVHWIQRPDPQRDLHDHPVAFWSFIVSGWYVEETPEGRRTIMWLNRKPAAGIHRIVWVAPNTVTLVFASRRLRDWGFHTPKGWVPWREYEHLGKQGL